MSNGNQIEMMCDGYEYWSDGEGSYTVHYRCPVGGQKLDVDCDCTPGNGEIDDGFLTATCYECCQIVDAGIERAIVSRHKDCPFVISK